MIGYIIGIVVSLVTLIGLYTKIVFDYAMIKSTLNVQTGILVRVEAFMSNIDKRVSDLEKDVLVIKTQHKQNHKE